MRRHGNSNNNNHSNNNTNNNNSSNNSNNTNTNCNNSNNNTTNNSKIIINCSANFSSLRIHDLRQNKNQSSAKSNSRSPMASTPTMVINPHQNSKGTLYYDRPSTNSSSNNGDNTDVLSSLISLVPPISQYFTIEGKIGEGTFSKVYKARLTGTDKHYALKYVIPTIRPSRIATELRYLRDLGGLNNVCGVESALFYSGHTIIVLPYFQHDRFNEYMSFMSTDEVRLYMKNLFQALARIHSNGIIHRDIKPSNFLYNRTEKKFLLVDFGLAQNERDFMYQKSQIHMINSRRASTLKESTNLHPPPVTTTSRSGINSLSQVVGKPESKQLLISKKRTSDEHSKIANKKLKNTDGNAVPIESSVFNTPVTPSNAIVSPTDSVSTVGNNGNVQENATGFKTPTKTPVKSTLPSQVTIPETPLKTTRQSGKRMTAKRLITYDESPKSRFSDSCANFYCDCFQKPQVCRICTRKQELYAPRAGTAGFRAPEVLLKTAEQSTAIDIWSAGVIFISILSGRYPFFRNTDDMTALAEIVTLLGAKRVVRAAKKLGKSLIIDTSEKPPVDLKFTCETLRTNGSNSLKDVPDSAYDLLDRLLDPYPLKRITAEQALRHPFITGVMGEENKLDLG